MSQQLTLPIENISPEERESLYWRKVFGNKTKINIQERGRLALTHFIEAKKRIAINPSYGKTV